MQRHRSILLSTLVLLVCNVLQAQLPQASEADTIYAPKIDYAHPVTKTIAGVTISGAHG